MAVDGRRYKTRKVSSTTRRHAVATVLSRQQKSVSITSGQRAAIVGGPKR